MSSAGRVCGMLILWIYITIECAKAVREETTTCDFWSGYYPSYALLAFVFSRGVEVCCFKILCYALTVIPLNFILFIEGVFVIVYARSCVHETIVPFIIVYAVLSI